ncbi:alpha/beta fold hydrolase BchO [Roseibium sp.]|uniref:alpha/beta fold hydrolase BchO n=1 Tax=Roseibium sp. TaxID=1936156 RepID=UPI003BABCD1F
MTRDRDWLDWERDGADWPFRNASRFVEVAGYRWHVQDLGPPNAPCVLLIHGTGAASFSWRNVVPLLENRFRLIVPDLPCHGFTRPTATPDLSLEGMTTSIRSLLNELAFQPLTIIGHSAGAVIGVSLVSAAQKSMEHGRHSHRVLGINGALKPIRGNRVLSPMAKALFANPLSASMFSLLAKSTPLGHNLLTATGSPIDAHGEEIYRRLLGSAGHVRGALGMMASWDLSHLNAMLRRLPTPLDLFAAEDDPMVPATSSKRAAGLAKHGSLTLTPKGGHLVHECHPETVVDWIETIVSNGHSNGADAA